MSLLLQRRESHAPRRTRHTAPGGTRTSARSGKAERALCSDRKDYRDEVSGSNMLEKAGTVAARDSCSGVTRYLSQSSSAG